MSIKTWLMSNLHRIFRRNAPGAPTSLQAFERALSWIDRNTLPDSGIRIISGSAVAYPEVTGYFIPTLLRWGEHARARGYARWLLSIQNPDGSWADPSGESPHTFDTGQVLKGLLAILPTMPEARDPIRRGCDWLVTQVEPSGRVSTPDTRRWQLPGGQMVPDSVYLYALEPLRQAAVLFDAPAYGEAVERALDHYLARPRLTDFDTLSHSHAYVIEALIDLGHPDRAAEGLAKVERWQRWDGTVPAYPGVSWVCSTGLAQYALLWYRLGNHERAERAFRRVCALQNPSGGFFGGYGRGTDYYPREEISWAVKYFLDALSCRIQASFEAEAQLFPDSISESDGRFRLIEQTVLETQPDVILDAGCGKGRFIRLIKQRHPELRAIGLDVSDGMLAHLPPDVERVRGSLLNMPLPDQSVDLVFCVEALKHAVNLPATVRELHRVLRHGGVLVVLDKNAACLGQLEIKDWEQWFAADELQRLLEQQGFEARMQHNLPYEGTDGADGLFLAWVARKCAPS